MVRARRGRKASVSDEPIARMLRPRRLGLAKRTGRVEPLPPRSGWVRLRCNRSGPDLGRIRTGSPFKVSNDSRSPATSSASSGCTRTHGAGDRSKLAGPVARGSVVVRWQAPRASSGKRLARDSTATTTHPTIFDSCDHGGSRRTACLKSPPGCRKIKSGCHVTPSRRAAAGSEPVRRVRTLILSAKLSSAGRSDQKHRSPDSPASLMPPWWHGDEPSDPSRA